jgi:lathosterol oxidase
MPDLSDPYTFLLVTVFMFLLVVGRYFLVAGLFQLWFYHIRKEKWQSRLLADKKVSTRQFYLELKWSVVTSLIFAVAGSLTAIIWQRGYTRLYTDPSGYGLWYLPVSLLISLFIHDTYYYWLHRWMHLPKVFRLLHKVHHDSRITSAWTAFSFHPLEGILQAIILPVIIIMLPIHLYVLLVQLILMTFSSVINHLEIETYPAAFRGHFFGRWLIGSTHHSLHHKQFRYNFGLYFTLWDNWRKTESPRFPFLFDIKTKA